MRLPGIKHPFFLRKHTSDISVFENIFAEKQYKVSFSFKPKIILDIGANIGLTSIYFKNRYPTASIWAIEPDKSNFDLLIKNTEKYPDIQCLNLAVWNRNTQLQVVDTGSGHWGFTTRECEGDGDNVIAAKPIGQLIRELGLSHVDILKIDIEGAEKQIFTEGFHEWLSRVNTLIIELHDSNVEGCSSTFFRALADYRFSLRLRHENLICDFRK